MEPARENCEESTKNVINGIVKEIDLKLTSKLTHLDLSSRNIKFEDDIEFPPDLVHLNISHNNLKDIPVAVFNMETLKYLDLSHNCIKLFDDTPRFCHHIEVLNLSHNNLAGPPYWVWVESPAKLTKIDLSNNINMTSEFKNGYLEELLQYKTLVTDVIIFNCRIKEDVELLSTFSAAKHLELGTADLTMYSRNKLGSVPCKGLIECCDIERLNLCNTQIYSIETNISIYKHLVQIDLSHNYINSLPSTFCDLETLEVCILSFNSILYLPEDMVKLKNLVCLQVDSNELCMIQENVGSLPKLKTLDLYNNCLYEVASKILDIEELDLSQNFMDEPDCKDYLDKKAKLRLNLYKSTDRFDGRKEERKYDTPSEYSPDVTDDEEIINYMNNPTNHESKETNRLLSSPEDWDSEDYWVPVPPSRTKSTHNPWQAYVRRKISEGNFCPMDLHTVPIIEKVKYEKQCNPKQWTVVSGQFDDLSDDDS